MSQNSHQELELIEEGGRGWWCTIVKKMMFVVQEYCLALESFVCIQLIQILIGCI
jgi:hypothetical protein